MTYTVYFPSAEDAERARRALERAGFVVTETTEGAPEEAPNGLVAKMVTTSEDVAGTKLNDALAGISHDPYIYWQASRLTGFVSEADAEHLRDLVHSED
jgi:hypothetical protein